MPGIVSAPPSPEADNVPGRPHFVNRFVQDDRPIPATAVRYITPERERRTSRPESITVYVPSPPPEMRHFTRCFAYAYCLHHPAHPRRRRPGGHHPRSHPRRPPWDPSRAPPSRLRR
uniref:Uncharacterized protein n=1 Tax=Leersia perrieri TaxID=77586 RepID=A0A0D9V8U0_9ORYZ